MIHEVRVPEIADNVETGDVTTVLVAVGDIVAVDQGLLEMETDKAALEVPCPVGGKVTEILVAAGDTIKVGEVIVKVDAGGGAASVPDTVSAPAPSASPAPSPVLPSPAPGPPRAGPRTAPESPAALEQSPEDRSPTASAAPRGPVAASPSVCRLARQLGVDLGAVAGSGPGGRITADDLRNNVLTEAPPAPEAEQPEPSGGASPASAESTGLGGTREPMSKVRRLTAAAMTQAWAVPHVTQFDKADISELEPFRKAHAAAVEAAGGKLTVTAILVKVMGAALRRFPTFNATVDAAGQAIVYNESCHVAVAVDTDRGLLVPVVRDIDGKSITEIAVEIVNLARRAKGKKIGPAELRGGSITISNLGAIGGTAFTPILNPPQVAILGVSRSRVEPVFVDGEFRPRTMLPLALSYDHRVIDGAAGARFLRWIAGALETPLMMQM